MIFISLVGISLPLGAVLVEIILALVVLPFLPEVPLGILCKKTSNLTDPLMMPEHFEDGVCPWQICLLRVLFFILTRKLKSFHLRKLL